MFLCKMHTISSALIAAISLFPQLAEQIPFPLTRLPLNDQSLSVSSSISLVQSQLGPCLSKNATLYFPNSPNYPNLTERWSLSSKSDFAVVLVPGVDNDVAATVRPTWPGEELGADIRESGSICEQVQYFVSCGQQGSWHCTESFECPSRYLHSYHCSGQHFHR